MAQPIMCLLTPTEHHRRKERLHAHSITQYITFKTLSLQKKKKTKKTALINKPY
jgi:hypothetical protein